MPPASPLRTSLHHHLSRGGPGSHRSGSPILQGRREELIGGVLHIAILKYPHPAQHLNGKRAGGQDGMRLRVVAEFLYFRSSLKSLRTRQKIVFAVSPRRNQCKGERKRSTDLFVPTLNALIILKQGFQEMSSCLGGHPYIIFPNPP